MTTAQLEQELDADNSTMRIFYTVEDAINAGDERPAMEAIAKRQNLWKKFWSRRGTNPITEVVEEYAN